MYFFIKLGRHVHHDERMNPIDFWDQRSKVKVTMDIYGNKLVNMIHEHDSNYTIVCFLIKLGRRISHGERMNPIDQRSKVKVIMDIYGNKLVNMIETKSLCLSLSNRAGM